MHKNTNNNHNLWQLLSKKEIQKKIRWKIKWLLVEFMAPDHYFILLRHFFFTSHEMAPQSKVHTKQYRLYINILRCVTRCVVVVAVVVWHEIVFIAFVQKLTRYTVQVVEMKWSLSHEFYMLKILKFLGSFFSFLFCIHICHTKNERKFSIFFFSYKMHSNFMIMLFLSAYMNYIWSTFYLLPHNKHTQDASCWCI